MRPVQVCLQDGADAVVSGRAEELVGPERRVDELGLLHVDPDEGPELCGPCDERLEIFVGHFLVEREPEVRELERDVRPELLVDQPLDQLAVLHRHRRRTGRRRDRLAEQRGVRVEARVVESSKRHDALVERLARDEARGPDAHPVPLDEALQALAVRCAEDRGSGD